MTRRQYRENVFKLLFRAEFYDEEEYKGQIDSFPSDDTELEIEDDEAQKIKDKVERIYEKIDEIDDILNEVSKGWKVNRMGKTELTILRLAVYEIKYDDDIPTSVAINEAVELSKKYGQEDAGAFVNGVLSKVAD